MMEKRVVVITGAGKGIGYATAMRFAQSGDLLALNYRKTGDALPKVTEIANAPGEKILPGELGKALDLIAAGQDIDYQGATAVELIGAGESAGTFREIEIKDDKIETVKYR